MGPPPARTKQVGGRALVQSKQDLLAQLTRQAEINTQILERERAQVFAQEIQSVETQYLPTFHSGSYSDADPHHYLALQPTHLGPPPPHPPKLQRLHQAPLPLPTHQPPPQQHQQAMPPAHPRGRPQAAAPGLPAPRGHGNQHQYLDVPARQFDPSSIPGLGPPAPALDADRLFHDGHEPSGRPPSGPNATFPDTPGFYPGMVFGVPAGLMAGAVEPGPGPGPPRQQVRGPKATHSAPSARPPRQQQGQQQEQRHPRGLEGRRDAGWEEAGRQQQQQQQQQGGRPGRLGQRGSAPGSQQPGPPQVAQHPGGPGHLPYQLHAAPGLQPPASQPQGRQAWQQGEGHTSLPPWLQGPQALVPESVFRDFSKSPPRAQLGGSKVTAAAQQPGAMPSQQWPPQQPGWGQAQGQGQGQGLGHRSPPRLSIQVPGSSDHWGAVQQAPHPAPPLPPQPPGPCQPQAHHQGQPPPWLQHPAPGPAAQAQPPSPHAWGPGRAGGPGLGPSLSPGSGGEPRRFMGALQSLRAGPSEEQRQVREQQRLQLQADLQEQIRQKAAQRAQEKAQEAAAAAREEAALRAYHQQHAAQREQELRAMQAAGAAPPPPPPPIPPAVSSQSGGQGVGGGAGEAGGVGASGGHVLGGRGRRGAKRLIEADWLDAVVTAPVQGQGGDQAGSHPPVATAAAGPVRRSTADGAGPPDAARAAQLCSSPGPHASSPPTLRAPAGAPGPDTVGRLLTELQQEQARLQQEFSRQAALMEQLAQDASAAVQDRDRAWQEVERVRGRLQGGKGGAGQGGGRGSVEQQASSGMGGLGRQGEGGGQGLGRGVGGSGVLEESGDALDAFVVSTHLVPRDVNAIPTRLATPLEASWAAEREPLIIHHPPAASRPRASQLPPEAKELFDSLDQLLCQQDTQAGAHGSGHMSGQGPGARGAHPLPDHPARQHHAPHLLQPDGRQAGSRPPPGLWPPPASNIPRPPGMGVGGAARGISAPDSPLSPPGGGRGGQQPPMREWGRAGRPQPWPSENAGWADGNQEQGARGQQPGGQWGAGRGAARLPPPSPPILRGDHLLSPTRKAKGARLQQAGSGGSPGGGAGRGRGGRAGRRDQGGVAALSSPRGRPAAGPGARAAAGGARGVTAAGNVGLGARQRAGQGNGAGKGEAHIPCKGPELRHHPEPLSADPGSGEEGEQDSEALQQHQVRGALATGVMHHEMLARLLQPLALGEPGEGGEASPLGPEGEELQGESRIILDPFWTDLEEAGGAHAKGGGAEEQELVDGAASHL